MSDRTKVEWADASWSPVTGCSPVSPGCHNCYASRMAKRFPHLHNAKIPPTMARVEDFREIVFHADRLDQPLRWKKPRRVFVGSMTDLFHEYVREEWIDDVFARMSLAHHHTYQILTKRPERMYAYITGGAHLRMTRLFKNFREYTNPVGPWPLPNVWLGVTAENQEMADQRIPILLQTPAANRFVSIEPCLSSVDLLKYLSGGTIHEQFGERVSDSGCARSIQRGQRREDLEARGNDRREQDGGAILSSNVRCASPSGNQRENRIPGGDVFPRSPEEARGCCPQGCLDDRKSLGYTGQDGSEPQGRNKEKPSPVESGSCDEIAECPAFLPGVGEEAESTRRGKERDGEINRGAGFRDSGNVQEPINGAVSNRQAIRDHAVGGVLYPPSPKLGSPSLDWVICGGETGPGARQMRPDWPRSLRDQCQEAGVPFFFKGWGTWGMKKSDPDYMKIDGREWKEFPK